MGKMKTMSARIIMITPYTGIQRGNSLTTARLQHFMGERGYRIDRLSLENPNWAKNLSEMLSSGAYNLIHGFHALHFGQVLHQVPAVANLPIILTTTGTDLNYDLLGPNRQLVLQALYSARKIVVFNQDFSVAIQERFPDLIPRLVIIPQGVFLESGPIPARRDVGLAEEDFVFLLPSGLRPVKNVEMAIDALERLHQEDRRIRLLIIGPIIDTEYAAHLLSRIENTDWIIYRGEVAHAEMKGLLGLGDVVLNTSHAEGQPQAALEAMSLGKPCILSAVVGNTNIIQPDQEGFYVRDSYEMTVAARKLATDPQLRREMGEKARRLVQARFALKSELNSYGRLYRDLTGNPPTGQ